MNYCKNCGKEIAKNRVYCSTSCQQEYQSNYAVKEWLAGERTGMSGDYKIADYVRRYMLKKVNYKCELCGWGEINPFTNKIPLEIHHIDGNYKNTVESNLQVLCPNCHSLTATHRGSNLYNGRGLGKYQTRANQKVYCIDCGIEITPGATRCRNCSNKHRETEYQLPITREELKNLIRTMPFTQIGLKFNVTDNGIRKWCKKYNLPAKRSEIKNYSDEEWEKI